MKRRVLAMPSRLAAVLGAAALTVTAVLPAASSSAPAALAASASYASLACPGTSPDFALTTQAPVLLVHGLDDSKALWTQGSPSMTQAISSALGGRVKIAYFDYHGPASTHWVKDPDIGQRLAGCINWLAGRSASGKVIIVAHSMGGLAVRCAVDTACANGSAASPDKIGLEITLDTPNLGTFPGLVAVGKWLCYSIPTCPGWLKLAKTDAGIALDPYSASMAKLPLLPVSVPVHAFAGKITITTSLFGAGPFSIVGVTNGDAGDIAVPVASALAEMPSCDPPDPVPAGGYTCATTSLHSGPGSGTTVENCGNIQTGQLDAWLATSAITWTLALPCWHQTEVTNPLWQAAVVAAIKTATDALAGGGRQAAGGASEPTAYVFTGDGVIIPISLATGAAGTPVKVGKGPDAVAITPDGRTAYMVMSVDSAVTPVDLKTGFLGTPIPVGTRANAIAITPDGSTAYVVNGGDDTVTPINLATGTPATPIPVGTSPWAIAITPDGKTAFVVDEGDNAVTPIDLASGTPGTPIPVGKGPTAIAITPDGRTAYVAGDGTIMPIDVAADAPGTPITADAWGIAITPDSRTAYVNSLNFNTLTPIDLASGTVGTGIDFATEPMAVAITPDGKTAYVVCVQTGSGVGSVIPVDLATGTPGAPVITGVGGLALIAIAH